MLVDLVLVGFGSVGRRFARLLMDRADVLAREFDLQWRVTGIATGRHGATFDPAGVPLDRALATIESGGSFESDRRGSPAGAFELIAAARATTAAAAVMVETTVLDIARGQPAIDHVRTALASGAHVITANKGPVAFAYSELASDARRANRAFLFEGAVMDGIPVFNLVRDTMPAVEVLGFRGVVNSTTNYMLTAMEAGAEAAGALAEMQAAGIAERDASFDVDGWDSAAKTAALVNVLMDGTTTPHQIERVGIGRITRNDVQSAMQRGERIRLVASADRRGPEVVARVAPLSLPVWDPLAQLRGTANALVLRTDLLGEVCVMELDSGLTQTAYALLSDLLTVRRRL